MKASTKGKTSTKETISLYISEEIKKDLEILAKAKGKALSSLVEEMMMGYLKDNKKQLREAKVKLNLIEAVRENKEFKSLHSEILNIIKETKER
jgi:hypothetical protein